jgi:hypothetical protein
MMGLGLSIDYTLFIVSRFQDERRKRPGPHQALEVSQAPAPLTPCLDRGPCLDTGGVGILGRGMRRSLSKRLDPASAWRGPRGVRPVPRRLRRTPTYMCSRRLRALILPALVFSWSYANQCPLCAQVMRRVMVTSGRTIAFSALTVMTSLSGAFVFREFFVGSLSLAVMCAALSAGSVLLR